MANHEQLIEQEWVKTGGENPLGRYGSFQKAITGTDGWMGKGYNALGVPLTLTCIDEGISGYDIDLDYKMRSQLVRTAGSGILAGDRQLGIMQEQKDRIGTVLSHGECGAAAKFAQENGLSDAPDLVGERAARNIAQSLDASYLGNLGELRRPAGLHVARAVYYDGTERGFETSRIQNLPIGFGISRGFMGREGGMENADLAIQIATGPHGFGELFTEETPLYLVGITDKQPGSIPSSMLQGELEVIKKGVPNVAIDIVRLTS